MCKYSVIIPALNEADYIGPTLERLQAARARGQEVLLVDGGSSDETCAIANGTVDRLLQCEPGRARQMNHGARFANGEVFVFLHADTLVPVEFDRILDARGVCARAWGSFDVRLSGSHFMFRCIERLMNLRSRATNIVMGDQALFVGRHLFRQLDGYADIPLMEDVELSSRLKKTSPSIRIEQPVVSSSRRWERYGIARTTLLSWKLRCWYAVGVDPHKFVKRYH